MFVGGTNKIIIEDNNTETYKKNRNIIISGNLTIYMVVV